VVDTDKAGDYKASAIGDILEDVVERIMKAYEVEDYI
jgi:hypothetical protein